MGSMFGQKNELGQWEGGYGVKVEKRGENNTKSLKVSWPLDPPPIIALDTELKESSNKKKPNLAIHLVSLKHL